MRSLTKNGFSVLELVVCIGVLTTLVGLLLPAVQSARESARIVHCQNNLRQIGLAVFAHEASFRHLPGGGWGYAWLADPKRGSGPRQPGGWIAQALPFAEYKFHQDELERNLEQPLALFRCPSKPLERLKPYAGRVRVRNGSDIGLSFRSDYAGCGGDRELSSHAGPVNLEAGILSRYPWRHRRAATGVFFQGSWIRLADITDGSSNTMMVSEKYVCLDLTYRDPGDDQAALMGDDHDIRRWTQNRMRHDARLQAPEVFGSSHSFGCNALLCDGAVKQLAFSIELATFQKLGSKNSNAGH